MDYILMSAKWEEVADWRLYCNYQELKQLLSGVSLKFLESLMGYHAFLEKQSGVPLSSFR